MKTLQPSGSQMPDAQLKAAAGHPQHARGGHLIVQWQE
jgi:hypothetical protein